MTQQPDYHTKPISQLTRQDWGQACKDFVGELTLHVVLYGLGAMLCTTIGAMIWVSVWCGVLFVPIGVVAYHLFKKSQRQH